ncbi:Zinc finger, RING-type [Sesbania bispinosa]|nr:Zinc finger, RING-type [Sesbania bispinosa]
MEEDMEIDHIVDVPDTPDRLNAGHDNRKYVGNPEKRERTFSAANEMSNCSNYITVSPSDKSHPSKNAPIFRRAQTEKFSGLGTSTTHSNGTERVDKGKTISSKFPSKSSHHGPISILDLTGENRQFQQRKPTFSHRGSRDNTTENKKVPKLSIGNSSLPFITDSSNTSSNAFTGKCKLDDKTLPGPNIAMDRGKSISLSNDSHSQSKTEKQVSLPPCLSTTPRGRGHKRLVRNGCISPQNIATRAKQSVEQSSLQTNHVEQNHSGHSVSSNTMSPISIDDIVSEKRDSGRRKGKEVLIHPSSHGLNAGTIQTTSSLMINHEDANVTRNTIRNPEGQGGWRTTHNEKNADQHLYDVNEHHSRRNYDSGRFINRQNMNRMGRRDTGSSQNGEDAHASLLDHTPRPTLLIIPEEDQSTRPRPPADTLTKRQRKRGSTSGNPNEASHNTEIMFLNSSGESSGSSRNRVSDPEVIELLSTPRYINRISEDLDDNDNNSLDARARQVEADEILARELQEQLYHDDFSEGRGFDEHLAWELQHAEDLGHTSNDSHHISHPTWFPRANRQPRSRTHQNPSNRRRTVPQVPFSNRMSQLRSRIGIASRTRSSTPIMASRGRRPRFPLDMDLDMRLDLLEALEDAVGDLNDMGMTDDIFHAHRDFNEDDYEMLLALDEQNHQHTGATANQINSLPQSTIQFWGRESGDRENRGGGKQCTWNLGITLDSTLIYVPVHLLQTDNFTEACAICLETPVKGEIIRHLPCLHKFHKDCIDPWLRRKTSCPVCKSSIT